MPFANGMPNAAVLPEPVRDWTIRSRPAVMSGKRRRLHLHRLGEAHVLQGAQHVGVQAQLGEGRTLRHGGHRG